MSEASMKSKSKAMDEKTNPCEACSHRYVLPLRFAVCSYTRQNIPSSVIKYAQMSGIIGHKFHADTLRILDSGYLYVCEKEDIKDYSDIDVYEVNNGQYRRIFPFKTSWSKTIEVSKNAEKIYMQLVRIPPIEKDFLLGSPYLPHEKILVNLAQNIAGNMQLIQLGPPSDQDDQDPTATSFGKREIPNSVEEYSSTLGIYARLACRPVGWGLLHRRDGKKYAYPDIDDWLKKHHWSSHYLRWDASCAPYVSQNMDDLPQGVRTACLADPVGQVYDLVQGYSKSVMDIDLFYQWNEPVCMSGHLTKAYVESPEGQRKIKQERNNPSHLAQIHPYYTDSVKQDDFHLEEIETFFKEYNNDSIFLERELLYFIDDWLTILANTQPVFSYFYQLTHFFVDDDQAQPCPVDPASYFKNYRPGMAEKLALPLTVARMSILARSFMNIASRETSFKKLHTFFFKEGAEFFTLMVNIISQGYIPGTEYNLLLTQLQSYLGNCAQQKETLFILHTLVNAFYKRLGWEPREYASSLHEGLVRAQLWFGSDLVPGLSGEDAFSALSTGTGSFANAFEAFFSEDSALVLQQHKELEAAELAWSKARAAADAARKELSAANKKWEEARTRCQELGYKMDELDARIARAQRASGQLEVHIAGAREDILRYRDAYIQRQRAHEKYVTLSADLESPEKQLLRRNYRDKSVAFHKAREEFRARYAGYCGELPPSTHAKGVLRCMMDDLAAAKKLSEKLDAAIEHNFTNRKELLIQMRQADLELLAKYQSWKEVFLYKQKLLEIFQMQTIQLDKEKISNINNQKIYSKLGPLVKGLDACISTINIFLCIRDIEKFSSLSTLSARSQVYLSLLANTMGLLNQTLSFLFRDKLKSFVSLLGKGVVLLTVAVDGIAIRDMFHHKEYAAAGARALSMLAFVAGPMLAAGYAAGAAGIVTGGSSLLVSFLLLVTAGTLTALSELLRFGPLEDMAKNNYWSSSGFLQDSWREKLGRESLLAIDDAFDNFAWKDFWVHVRRAICKMYEPRVEISAFDNKLLVRCTYAPVPSLLIPRVGVGVRRYGASEEDVRDVAPDCLLHYSDGPDEMESGETALPHVDLLFDFARIIQLHDIACDTNGPFPRYALCISAGVLHTYDAYTRFSKTEVESFFVNCDPDPGQPDLLPKVKDVGQGLTGLLGYVYVPPPVMF